MMKKTLTFGLLLLIFLLLNCRQELAMTETEQQKNRIADFFANAKNQSNTNAKMSNSFDYVEFLKQENLENNFVSQMRDQTGIPIWDKAICMMNKENGTTIEDLDQIIVPLSLNSTTISSLLFVTKNKNGDFSYKNTDNELLKNTVYNNSYSVELRKQKLSTFLLMDNWCFGSNAYSNVPNDIFGENTSSKPFYVSPKTPLSNMMNRITVCFEVMDPPVLVPDDCSCHYDRTVCITFEEGGGGDGEGSGTNGNGHSDGGGGGGGTPSDNPTTTGEPCGRNKAWYRINYGCSETGGSGESGDLDDVCEKLKKDLQKAKELIENDTVKTQNDIMKATISTDTFEKAMYWGRNSLGKMKTSNIVDGSPNNTTLSISGSQFTPEAYAHNHPGTDGYTNFSTTDINSFHNYHQGFSTLNHNFVNAVDGSSYVMTIEDQAEFDAFVAQYPMSSIDVSSTTNPNGTGDWNENLDIYKDELNAGQYFISQGKTADEAYDLTMGYLIQKYNMGIMISKKGADGNFHPIQVEVIADPIFGIPYVYIQVNPCNL